MKHTLYITLFISTFLLITGCGQPTQETTPTTDKTKNTPMVTVSILPQQYFLHRIGGENSLELALTGLMVSEIELEALDGINRREKAIKNGQ